VNTEDFSLSTAKAAAERDELHVWVADFLSSRGSDNALLAAALAQQPYWWSGPMKIELDRLERLAGPEQDAVCPIEPEEWDEDLDSMSSSIEQGWEPPPLIVEFDEGQLLLQDGNHRAEALERSGASRAWVVVYFADPADRARFDAALAS
jgi:hypothetical protein